MILPRLKANYFQDLNNKRLNVGGSPPFEIECSDIAASAKELFGFESNSDYNKFLPLNFVRIINNGGTDLKIYLNQGSNGETILDDTIYSANQIFRSFIVENLDSSNAVDGSKVYITVQRKPRGGY